MDEAIQAANERMVYVTGDREAIWAYERRQIALSDHTSQMNYARDKGLEEGRKEGREEVACNALAKGLPFEMISEITGVDLETIQRLSKAVNN